MVSSLLKSSICLGLFLQLSALSMTGCSKKKSSSDSDDPAATSTIQSSTPGVTQTEGNELSLTGQLALTPMGLVAENTGILAFKIMAGEVSGDPTAVDVDADGRFTFTVTKAEESLQFLIDEMKKEPDARDWDALYENASKITDIGDMTVEDLKNMPDEDLQEGIAGLAEELQSAGTMTMLVAYDKSGDKVAEAESFRFINLPTAAGNALPALPNKDLKGSLNFGQITGDGQDVSAEVNADDALDLSTEALEALSDLSKVLKGIKNSYMNDAWSVQPFYFWKSNVAKEDVVDSFSDISLNSYHGYGFYVPSNGDQGLTYDGVCGGSSLTFTPPSAVNEKDDQGNLSSKSSYSNSGAVKGNQGSNRYCYVDGYYAREDVRDGKTSFMLNFGTGGSIQDSPAGLWRMEIDGSEVGRYDLALASPMKDDKPMVLLPQAKFIKTGSNITGVEVELYRHNGTEYVKVTDLAAVKKLVKEFSGSITRTSDNGESMAELTVNDDGTITGSFDSSERDGGDVRNPPVAANDVTAFAVYYKVGSSSYRMEFR